MNEAPPRPSATRTTVEAVGGLEDDGSVTAWTNRPRDRHQFSKGVRVRTSPKRWSDPINYGTVREDPVNDSGDWTVLVDWDDYYRNAVAGQWGTDLRSLCPLETY